MIILPKEAWGNPSPSFLRIGVCVLFLHSTDPILYTHYNPAFAHITLSQNDFPFYYFSFE